MGITKTGRLLRIAAVAALAMTMTAAVACSSDDDDDEASPTTAATSAATKPAGGDDIDISGVEELSDGELNIGSDIAYAPIEFLDESTNEPAGLDIDIANALAEVLGVEAKFENGTFDGLLPALDAERHDVIMSAMTASDERKQTVDFVEYFNAGSGIIVATGNPKAIQDADDLCGKRVAVQEGTTQAEFLDTQTGTCTSGGNDAITILKFGTDPEAVQALIAGQADAEMADFPVAAYSASQSNGALEVLDNQIDPAPYGIAIRKSSNPLRDALQKAFDQIVKDGTYAKILEKWDLSAGALEE